VVQFTRHLSPRTRFGLYAHFRGEVDAILKQNLSSSAAAKDATDANSKTFDPLSIRESASIGGLLALGSGFSWTEPQRDYLHAYWAGFSELIEQEAERQEELKKAEKEAKRTFKPFGGPAGPSCMPADGGILLSDEFLAAVEALEAKVRKEHFGGASSNSSGAEVTAIEEILRKRNDWLAAETEKFCAFMRENPRKVYGALVDTTKSKPLRGVETATKSVAESKAEAEPTLQKVSLEASKPSAQASAGEGSEAKSPAETASTRAGSSPSDAGEGATPSVAAQDAKRNAATNSTTDEKSEKAATNKDEAPISSTPADR